ncbi:MAG: protein kinase [Deltaproteobacteria bacterium]|nr:protein kinase [Deltaproteobacteria bacterium]MDQ3298192.1 protein kinase [Myxococcota bacterium]
MVAGQDVALVGRLLANRYDILALIGAGGMGAVYRARDRELDELVALKVIRSDLAGDTAIVERFRSEVKLARRVTHPNVARTFELGDADGVMFCTMELIEGESLTRRIARHRRLSVAEATTIACAVCEALAAAHAVDVIHRDIKPDNVLITSSGRVVLADFGIASARITMRVGGDDGDVSGTPAYMAPEQARGEPPTPATDVYAVGLLLYEMLTGGPAFSGETTQILNAKQEIKRLVVPPSSDLDPQLVETIAAAAARDVGSRIASAVALRARLAPWANVAKLETAADDVPVDPGEIRTLIVLSPRAEGADARLYLAEAVHEQLLRRLARLPRLRVLPRAGANADPKMTTVELVATDVLTIAVSTPGGGEVLTLRLPLAVAQIGEAAEAATTAIVKCLVSEHPPSTAASTEALDLLLHARHLGQRDVAYIGDAIAKLERANELLPGDPRIAASLAILQVRRAFFSPATSAELLAASRDLVNAALAAGPRLAEAHLAAGHLELNIGEARVAAGHYRVAIACSPHVAEAHESLGRMLLEAGFLEPALARLEEAIAIAPSLIAIRWDIARAFALEERWADHDEVMAELARQNFARPVRSLPLRLRFAAWRGDRDAIAAMRLETRDGFDTPFVDALLAVFADGAWDASREVLVGRVLESTEWPRRRRAFVAQLVAEVAGYAGDATTCLAMIGKAVDTGLFDLHWLDRCPLLGVVRTTDEVAGHRVRVKQRADAILDALYGDHDVGALSDTVAATVAASRP